MSFPLRSFYRAWFLLPLATAVAFIAWTGALAKRHVERVSATPDWSVEDSGPSADRGAWKPRLIIPDSASASYEWLDETRQMLESRQARVRHVDFENVPFGLDLHTPSPYRWWLGLVAVAEHAAGNRALGPSLEAAALAADPLLHLLLLVAVTLAVAWRFGPLAASLSAGALTVLFPLADAFLAGIPDDQGLALALGLLAVLPLLSGLKALHVPAAGEQAEARCRRWFALAGLFGAAGLWVNVTIEVPILAGIALGGLLAAAVTRRDPADRLRLPPWRAWSAAGSVFTLAAYLGEYAPDFLGGWQLRVNHPLYGVAWIGLGELLMLARPLPQSPKLGAILGRVAGALVAVLALAALPISMHLTHSLGFLEADLPMLHLTRLSEVAVAPTPAAWVTDDGLNGAEWAALLPACLLIPALALLWLRRTAPESRAAVAVALGPVAVALGFAWVRISWWNEVDGLLVVLIVALTSAVEAFRSRAATGVWAAVVVLLLVPGWVQVWPSTSAQASNAMSEPEVVGLLERDLAHWMTGHIPVDSAALLAPPDETAALYYFGRVRGLVTLGWENRDGIAAAIRVVSASTPEEALELLSRRQITHLIMPSWDSYLVNFAKIGMGQLSGSFLDRLHAWELPNWLRPVAFPLPNIPGFEGQSITIFQVVDEQDDAAAASRLAEYFVDMDHLDFAAMAAQHLNRFPADLGALIARAEVANARSDAAEFERVVGLIRPRLSGGGERSLTWDQRVALAIVLAQARLIEASRTETTRCVSQADEAGLRELSPLVLYRFQVLLKGSGLELPAPLKASALRLLPPGYRQKLVQ